MDWSGNYLLFSYVLRSSVIREKTMSSLGCTWKVPKRAISKDIIDEITGLVLTGHSSDEIGAKLGRTSSNVRNIIMRHTVGIRRLRSQAA